MTCLNNPFMKLMVNCDGVNYPVEAICTSAGEANILCGLNPSLSVMGEDGNGRYYLVGSAKPDGAKPTPLPTTDALRQMIDARKCNHAEW